MKKRLYNKYSNNPIDQLFEGHIYGVQELYDICKLEGGWLRISDDESSIVWDGVEFCAPILAVIKEVESCTTESGYAFEIVRFELDLATECRTKSMEAERGQMLRCARNSFLRTRIMGSIECIMPEITGEQRRIISGICVKAALECLEGGGVQMIDLYINYR